MDGSLAVHLDRHPSEAAGELRQYGQLLRNATSTLLVLGRIADCDASLFWAQIHNPVLQSV
jgi:hypothetical protein